MLLVEQYVHLALSISDCAYVMQEGRIALRGPQEGRIALRGPSKQIAADDALQAAYLGM